MRESVQLDLMGQKHVDFDDTTFVSVRSGTSRDFLPTWVNGRRVVTNIDISYCDIQWIGGIVRRQWWLLLPGLFFTLMGPIWASKEWGNWGPFAISITWFILFGLFPLLFFAKGRTYLGIATADKIVIFPMDRQRKKVARILGLLRQVCTSTQTDWQLDGTPFASVDIWDNRSATGIGFDQKRYLRITVLVGLYGLANLLKNVPQAGPASRILGLIVVVFVLLWGVLAVYRRLRAK